jgi:RNA polymerase sigma-70 factor (ECF subfamily)
MDRESCSKDLNGISTQWDVLRQAHQGQDQAGTAQRLILERYGNAVRRYLRGAVRDPDAADDLFQEFACRFLKGGLRGADPGRGRFRDYVKGVLFHLIADHHRRKPMRPLASALDEPAVEPSSTLDCDREFLQTWRDELLARCWTALDERQRRTGQPFYTVLRFRANHPGMKSPELARHLSEELGKPMTATAVRQTLHRARQMFADLLLDEVAHSLQTPSLKRLEEELLHLGLIEYCRLALERWQAEGDN